MASNAAEAQYTSSQVAFWLKETMKLSTAKDIDVKQLSSSFLPVCKGRNMAAFWNSMMTHVRPTEEVDTIKQNIELSNAKNRHDELIAELEHKRRKLRAVREERDSLKLQVNKKKEEVQFLNQQVKDSRELKKKMHVKSHLLRNYSDVLDDQLSSCKVYLDWITELKDTYKRTHNSDSTFDKAVLSAYHVINETIQDVSVEQKNLFPLVGDLIKNFSPDVIVSALTEITKDSIKGVRDDVEVFNVENELERLHDKIQDGALSHGPLGGTMLKGMLEKWDMNCVKNYLKFLESERNYKEKVAIATAIRENIIEHLKLQYEFEPTNLQLAIDDLDAQAEIAAAKTCLKCFQSAIAELKDRILEGTKTQQNAMLLNEKISASSKVIREDQEKLVQTLRRNSDLAASLLGHQQEVQSYGEHAVCSLEDHVKKGCTSARSAFQRHLSAFNHADMDKLRQIESFEGLCPLKNLSIHRYNDISEEKGNFSYQKTLCCLAVHGHAPPSAALQKIYEIRSNIARLEAFQNSVDEINAASFRRQLMTVQQLCRETDAKIFEKLDPQYKRGIQVADHAKGQCRNLGESVKVWYDQPAQYQAPWLTLDGLTLQEWRAQKHS